MMKLKIQLRSLEKTHDIKNYDTSATMTGTTSRTINATLSGVTDYPKGLMFGGNFYK